MIAAERLVNASFAAATHRDAAGVPRISADFVAEQGQFVRILDVRDEDALVGPLGHIPAATHMPLARLGEVPAILDAATCIVLVSNRGGRAGIAARMLEELGMLRVAAMDGGMAVWKQLGYATQRDPESFRRQLVALRPGVGRDGQPLVTVAPGAKLTAEQIDSFVGQATTVQWVKLGAFLMNGRRSCVDGRDSAGVIGTPGGDAGELLLALAAVERAESRQLTYADVERVLLADLDAFGRFYMHSDITSMNHLIVDGYRKDPRIAPHITHLDSAMDWRRFHQHVPTALQAPVLEHLTRADVMGCGHLKAAMTVPTYAVRPELSRMFLEAFHRLRWAGAPELEWVVLGGHHAEAAVVNITVEGDLHSYTRIPLVTPSLGGVQMFVNHPQVTSYLRIELAAALREWGVTTLPHDVLTAAIEELGTSQVSQTLLRLANGLPLYEIRFASDGTHRVEPRGVIGA